MVCLLFAANNFQSTDEEQCSKYLEYINLLCNFAILYFDISEDNVSRMQIQGVPQLISHPKITRHSKTVTRLATIFLHTHR